MSPYEDDNNDRDFDDRGPEDWEELFSRPERDLEDYLNNDSSEEDAVHDPSFTPDEDGVEVDRDYEEQISDARETAEGPRAQTKHLPPGCVSIAITPAMWEAASSLSGKLDEAYGDKNNFGNSDSRAKQLRGVLGEMAYAQAAFNDWRRQGEIRMNQADFGLVDVKTSRHHPHRELATLNLIESESSPGTEPPCYAIYVQAFVDLNTRVAYLAGWCTGSELRSGGKSPIPKGNGALGYMRPVSKLHPMSTLLAKHDQLDDGRQTRFRPSNLGP
jgi:hypothetical protein